MKHKHTPGPWTAKSYAAPRADNGDIGIINGKGMLVAVAYSNTCTRDNASLIAAAPDLLEAAEFARDLAMRMTAKADIPYCAEFAKIAQELDAAIAKAYGVNELASMAQPTASAEPSACTGSASHDTPPPQTEAPAARGEPSAWHQGFAEMFGGGDVR